MDCRVPHLDENSLTHYNDSRRKCFLDVKENRLRNAAGLRLANYDNKQISL